jgi:hypothetical protein
MWLNISDDSWKEVVMRRAMSKAMWLEKLKLSRARLEKKERRRRLEEKDRLAYLLQKRDESRQRREGRSVKAMAMTLKCKWVDYCFGIVLDDSKVTRNRNKRTLMKWPKL